jgi:hypothetical protein
MTISSKSSMSPKTFNETPKTSEKNVETMSKPPSPPAIKRPTSPPA